MKLQVDNLGKVCITVEEDYWDINKEYDKLTVVERSGTFGTYLSRMAVPTGVELTNRQYWIPFSSLKEDIVIDYNSFIAKYQDILDDYNIRLDGHEGRLVVLETIRNTMVQLTNKSNEVIQSSKTSIEQANNVASEASQLLNRVNNTLTTIKEIRDIAQQAATKAESSANQSADNIRLANSVLNQANIATNTANEASKKATEAVENSEKALCVVNKYYNLATELKNLVDVVFEQIKEQDAIVKQTHCQIIHLHDHLKCKIEKINESICNINRSLICINNTIDELFKKLDNQDVKLRDLRDRIDTLSDSFYTLVNGNPTTAIESFKEIIRFLESIEDDQTLKGIIGGIESQISNFRKDFNDHVKNNEDSFKQVSDKFDKVDDTFNQVNQRFDNLDDSIEETNQTNNERFETIESNVDNLLKTKVDKIIGKQLSTNDFTNEHKEKLEDIDEIPVTSVILMFAN